MLQRPESANVNASEFSPVYGGVNIDVQQQLNLLEEIIFDSPHIPLTGITMVEEEKLLDQLDVIRANLPEAIAKALEILQQKAQLIFEAEQYAEEIMVAAERKAAQLLDETLILRQAEQDAARLRQDVERECKGLREQTLTEVEEMRRRTAEELKEMRAITISDCEEMQAGADQYTGQVLMGLEGQLKNMLTVVRNGRQQLDQVEKAVMRPEDGAGKPSNGTGGNRRRNG